jgi:hypothetical protein
VSSNATGRQMKSSHVVVRPSTIHLWMRMPRYSKWTKGWLWWRVCHEMWLDDKWQCRWLVSLHDKNGRARRFASVRGIVLLYTKIQQMVWQWIKIRKRFRHSATLLFICRLHYQGTPNELNGYEELLRRGDNRMRREYKLMWLVSLNDNGEQAIRTSLSR